MAESDFEKELRNRLSGLEGSVEDGAWDRIEKELPPKNNAGPVLAILLLLLLLGIGGYYFFGDEPGEAVADQPAADHPESVVSNQSNLDDESVAPLMSSPNQADLQKNVPSGKKEGMPERNNSPNETAPDADPVNYASMELEVDGRNEAGNTRGSSALLPSGDGLRALNGYGAHRYVFEQELFRNIEPLAIDETKTVYPPKRKKPAYLGLHISPQAAYHNFSPDTQDDILLESLEVDGVGGRTALQVGLSYQQYLNRRWSWYLSAGYMINRYKFTYNYRLPGDEIDIQEVDGAFVISSPGESRSEQVKLTRHYLSLGAGMFYLIDRDKFREHSVGLGADYLHSPGNSSPRVMADLSYRWSVLWQTGPLQQKEWRLDVGPVFRYELSPAREVATGLDARSYFIGVRAGLRLGF